MTFKKIPDMKIQDHIRFWSLVEKTGKHWLWRGPVVESGRLKFNFNSRNFSAKSVCWTLTRGPMKPNIQLRGDCGEPLCLDPDHQREIVVVCDYEKQNRMIHAKLTVEIVSAAKHRIAAGEDWRVVARSMGIPDTTAYAFASGATWTDVEPVGRVIPQREHMDWERAEQARKLRDKNVPTKIIAETIGASLTTVKGLFRARRMFEYPFTAEQSNELFALVQRVGLKEASESTGFSTYALRMTDPDFGLR